ncbi:hypothetical protein PFISCL1PPCAC_12742, partial [Pristionchus fissidentatus]
FFAKLKRGYGLLCTIRHCGELGTTLRYYCGQRNQAVNVLFVPARYSTFLPNARIHLCALNKCFTYCYNDF